MVVAPPLRESDGSDSSILRLVSASLAAAGAPPEGAAALEWGAGTPAPRKFANQLAVRHLLADGSPRSLGASSELLEEGGQFEAAETAPIMQAKLRRAFHPMRGKKSAPSFQSQTSYPDDMQPYA